MIQIQLIRNATLKINYAGHTILVDPMLCPQGAFPPFAGKENNPLTPLPMTVQEILTDVEMVLVTHTHPDHFDDVAKAEIPVSMPLICQPFNREEIDKLPFESVEYMEEKTNWNGIEIIRTGGKHGRGPILEQLGEVSGFLLQATGIPSVYIVGDSVLEEEVTATLDKYTPDIIITNSGGAAFPGMENNPILMEEKETIEVAKKMPQSKIIAVHMEALDHCHTYRQSLRNYGLEHGINEQQLLIPADGEILQF